MRVQALVFPFLALLSSLILNSSCQVQQTSKSANANTEKIYQEAPPGTCRIQAQIVKVSSEMNKDLSSPCSKAPCKAKIKIQEILGYGSGFTNTLVTGDEKDAVFSFTLSPTQSILPDLKHSLPGLKKNDVFIAIIKTDISGSGTIQISDYKKL